ncbi:hypothetical protein E3T46_03515 [Cryobacterium sp. Hh11]|uniref:hypothetical protein n=1 Tax=Cryobacterium sp. Hh11 TaxID=2555868 RepID=UPI001069438D|nr:hypothetical protein [Cryobacterium sp. Hh11]TFD53396.1 hypothetical protein E3T46_03515 [Cryobacterium sp. Hh11]
MLNTTTVTTDLMIRPQSAAPLAYAVSQLGGVSCLASGEVVADTYVSVEVLPDASAQWTDYIAKNPDVVSGLDAVYGDASNVACFNIGGSFSCSVNILVGQNWIDVYAQGLNVEPSASNEAVVERVDPLILDIVNTVKNTPAPGPAWVAPTSTGMLPADCSVYASADEFRAAFGSTGEILISGDSDGDGWGIDNAGWAMTGGDRCVWAPESTGQTWPFVVTALPGGEWAFDTSARLMAAGGGVSAVAQGSTDIDRATFGCHVYSEFCTLDTVIAGNWVQFSAEKEILGTEHDVQTLLISIAERAVGRFSS